MNVTQAKIGQGYLIQRIDSEDEELKSFLFSLGCYPGETIHVIRSQKDGFTLAIKDARYNVDVFLAAAIEIEEQDVE